MPNLWPAGLVVACTLFIGGTIGLIIVAASQRSDLVAADYYQQELRYQTRLDALQRTAPFADRVAISTDASGRLLQIVLPAEALTPELAGRVVLYRPSAAMLDRAVPLQPDSAGIQTLDVSALEPGLWKVRLSWRSGEQDFYLERNIVLKRSRSRIESNPTTTRR